MNLLAVIWTLLIMSAAPDSLQYQVDNVQFSSLGECDSAARGWQDPMRAAALTARNGHIRLKFDATPPADAPLVTYSCVEQTR